jgi:hypothetical protein
VVHRPNISSVGPKGLKLFHFKNGSPDPFLRRTGRAIFSVHIARIALPAAFFKGILEGDGTLRPRVHVRAYERIRFGALEHVRAHTRRWPGQLSFDFMN